jgi:hypothetical protein
MDKRKSTGRSVAELERFFEMFPDATFCFDLAHARQVDTTMLGARRMLKRYEARLRQVHISELDSAGRHHRLSQASVVAGRRVASLIPESVAIVIESMIPQDQIAHEVAIVQRALSTAPDEAASWECQDWGALA